MEISSLPARFVAASSIAHKSQMFVAIANLITLAGTLWSGLVTFRLMKIVNDNLTVELKK